MAQRPLEQEIEFMETVLKISEREAAKEQYPSVFTAQAKRLRKELRLLKNKALSLKGESDEDVQVFAGTNKPKKKLSKPKKPKRKPKKKKAKQKTWQTRGPRGYEPSVN